MLGNEEILHRLGLLAGADDVAETNRMAKMLGEILVRTASQRCWTMASWSELPPLNWSSVLSQDPEEARAGLDRIRGDQESVEAAWSYLNSRKDLRRNIIYIVSGWLKICFLASSGLTTSTMISSSNFSLIGFA